MAAKVRFRIDRYVWSESTRWNLIETHDDASLAGRRDNRWTGGESIAFYQGQKRMADMDAIISFQDFGDGAYEYTGVVSFTEDEPYGSGMREVNEWKGMGNMERIRLEQWHIKAYAE